MKPCYQKLTAEEEKARLLAASAHVRAQAERTRARERDYRIREMKTETAPRCFARFHRSPESISILIAMAWVLGCLVVWGWPYISPLFWEGDPPGASKQGVTANVKEDEVGRFLYSGPAPPPDSR